MFNRLDCHIKTLYRTIKNFIQTGDNSTILGHSFVRLEHHENVTLDIYQCADCGKIQLIWDGNYEEV